jgi:hypothetical protein
MVGVESTSKCGSSLPTHDLFSYKHTIQVTSLYRCLSGVSSCSSQRRWLIPTYVLIVSSGQFSIEAADDFRLVYLNVYVEL